MLQPARVERRSPTLLVVADQLEIVALPRHAHADVTDAAPGVEPAMEGLKTLMTTGA
jgi:hypothetical protein